jgi:ATP-dependent Clp protease ATP-binding subunit ClpA
VINLEIFTDKLDKGALHIMHKSYEEALSRNHSQITPQHVILAIARHERDLFDQELNGLNRDPATTIREVEVSLARQRGMENEIRLSNDLRILLANALKRTYEQGQRLVGVRNLILAAHEDELSLLKKILKRIWT